MLDSVKDLRKCYNEFKQYCEVEGDCNLSSMMKYINDDIYELEQIYAQENYNPSDKQVQKLKESITRRLLWVEESLGKRVGELRDVSLIRQRLLKIRKQIRKALIRIEPASALNLFSLYHCIELLYSKSRTVRFKPSEDDLELMGKVEEEVKRVNGNI